MLQPHRFAFPNARYYEFNRVFTLMYVGGIKIPARFFRTNPTCLWAGRRRVMRPKKMKLINQKEFDLSTGHHRPRVDIWYWRRTPSNGSRCRQTPVAKCLPFPVFAVKLTLYLTYKCIEPSRGDNWGPGMPKVFADESVDPVNTQKPINFPYMGRGFLTIFLLLNCRCVRPKILHATLVLD